MNLDEAIKDMQERLKKSLDEDRRHPAGIAEYHRSQKDVEGTLTRLRLDWELIEPNLDNDTLVEPHAAIDLMMTAPLKGDLEDLLENGDMAGHLSDPLLKSMDGRIKRGKDLKHVEIYAANLFREVKPRKNTSEWTLFLTLYTEWE